MTNEKPSPAQASHARPSPARGWIQAALAGAVIAAAVCVYWAALDRDEAPSELDAAGGVPRRPLAPLATQEEAVRRGNSDRISVIDESITSEDLIRISKLDGLRSLTIGAYAGDVADLASLAALPRLESIRFDDLAVDDAGAATLSRIETLRRINVPRATFGDEGLASLATLPNLELLRFGSPDVTDAGIAELEAAPSLKWLHVIATPLTDRSLKSIARMPRLESFYADGCDFSDRAWHEALAARPDLHVHVDDLHLPDDPQGDVPHE